MLPQTLLLGLRGRAAYTGYELIIPPRHQEGGNCLQNFPSVFVMVPTLSHLTAELLQRRRNILIPNPSPLHEYLGSPSLCITGLLGSVCFCIKVSQGWGPRAEFSLCPQGIVVQIVSAHLATRIVFGFLTGKALVISSELSGGLPLVIWMSLQSGSLNLVPACHGAAPGVNCLSKCQIGRKKTLILVGWAGLL